MNIFLFVKLTLRSFIDLRHTLNTMYFLKDLLRIEASEYYERS